MESMSSFTSKTYTMSIFPLKTESGYSTEDFVCADRFKVSIKKRMKINILFHDSLVFGNRLLSERNFVLK